jgi:hypothetical protein
MKPVLALAALVFCARAVSAADGLSEEFASIQVAAVQSRDAAKTQAAEDAAAREAGKVYLTPAEVGLGTHHLRHAETFGKYAVGYNLWVLRAVDVVQSHAPGGGGYFADPKHADPPESPVGYALKLFDEQLLYPTRPTSFCSGASFAAFIEALNLIYADPSLGMPPESDLSPERREAMLMQEPDAEHSRREDGVKFWGQWNGSGYGANDALVQYSRMGQSIPPDQARAGDFLTMDWKSGNGHSTVFLGWAIIKGQRFMLVWSSQKSANGFGDYLIPWTRVEGVNVVRLTHPEALMTFDVGGLVSDRGLAMERPSWPPLPRARRGRGRGRRRRESELAAYQVADASDGSDVP